MSLIEGVVKQGMQDELVWISGFSTCFSTSYAYVILSYLVVGLESKSG